MCLQRALRVQSEDSVGVQQEDSVEVQNISASSEENYKPLVSYTVKMRQLNKTICLNWRTLNFHPVAQLARKFLACKLLQRFLGKKTIWKKGEGRNSIPHRKKKETCYELYEQQSRAIISPGL